MNGKRKFFLAAAVMVGLLAGCQNTQGAAAFVNGEKITQSQVSTVVNELRSILTNTQPAAVLSTLIVGKLTHPLAVEAGTAISDDQAVAFLQSATPNFDSSNLSPASLDFIRSVVEYQGLQYSSDPSTLMENLNTAAAVADIEVNPRYGTFDPSALSISQTQSWLITN